MSATSTPATPAPLRGVVVGAMSVLVTAAAHDLGGAALPSQAAAVALLAVCAGVGWMVSSTPAGRSRLDVALVAAQTLGHLALTVVDGHHHGALLDPRLAAAHLVAVGIGAVAVHGAERGIIAAARAMRRILPIVLAVAAARRSTPSGDASCRADRRSRVSRLGALARATTGKIFRPDDGQHRA